MQILSPNPITLALWVALPMAHTSRVESRLKMILDKTRSRRLPKRGMVALALALTAGLALAVATAQTTPRSLEAAITSGGYPSDTPAHVNAEIIWLQDAIGRFGDKDPWSGKAYYMLGNAQMSAGQFGNALVSYNKAIALPEPPYANSGIHSDARYERINTLASAGRYAEAIAETQILLQNGGRGMVAADLENLRERLPEFTMMQAFADKRAQVKSFYAAFPAPADPRWTQTLPGGVTVQFVGCQQSVGDQHTAWTPDGKRLAQAAFERNDGDSTPTTYSGFTAAYIAKEQAKQAHGVGFALRLTYPAGKVVKVAYALAGNPENGSIEKSEDGLTTENGAAVSNEGEISRATGGLRLTSAHFPNTQKQAALRVGIAVGTGSAPPPDAPDAAYQWVEFPNISLPPTQ